MVRELRALSLLGLLLTLSPLAAAESSSSRGLHVEDLEVARDGDAVVVQYRLDGAINREISERIDSGLPVSFTHHMRLVGKRKFWLDRVLDERTVTTSVQYDSLTRQFRLSRRIDGELDVTTITDEPARAMSWMTEVVGRLPLDSATSQSNLALKVKSNVQARFVLLFIPWDLATPWVRAVVP